MQGDGMGWHITPQHSTADSSEGEKGAKSPKILFTCPEPELPAPHTIWDVFAALQLAPVTNSKGTHSCLLPPETLC